jgi:hypothetical protein
MFASKEKAGICRRPMEAWTKVRHLASYENREITDSFGNQHS